MTQAPYRINYTQGPDGKVSIAIDIYGPLPDPLAGMSPEERRAVTRQRLSFSEYGMLWSVRRMPAAAKQVVWVEILARRRLAHLQKTQQAPAVPAPKPPDPVKPTVPYNPIVAPTPEIDIEPEMAM